MINNIKAIKIKLSDMKYRYDVFLMINLFFSFIDIDFGDEDWDLAIDIERDRVLIKGKDDEQVFNYEINEGCKPSEEIKKSIFIYLRER